MRMGWLVVLAAVLGCRSADRGGLHIDPVLAGLVSSDAVFVAGVRMDKVRSTGLYQRWVAEESALLERFRERTGLDIRTDLTELLVVSDRKHVLGAARGRFNPADLEARIQREGGRRMIYKGRTLIGQEQGALWVLNSSTVVSGPAAALRGLIDGRGRTRALSPLLERARKLPASSQLWAVSADPVWLAQAMPAPGNLANLRKLAGLLENGAFAADVSRGLSFSLQGSCRSEADARTLAEILRGLVGLARLSAPDEAPELLRAYDGIRVEHGQSRVEVKGEIPEDLLDKLMVRFHKGELGWKSLLPPEGSLRGLK